MRRLALVLLLLAAPAAAAPKKKPRPVKDYAWCAAQVESLDDDTCYVAGGTGANPVAGGKRTLVVFLHGVIGKHTDWSWTQERALLRQAKAGGYDAIFPRAPGNDVAYAWPGGAEAQAKYEAELIAGWKRAQKQLETRHGATYDQVFVMGFSSGAYYVSSLALRGRLGTWADGYAVFAGGSIGHTHVPAAHKVPVYVGICGADKQTAPHSRGLAGELATRGFPVRAEEHHVGHMFSDPHVARAIDFLRKSNADKPALPRLVD